ncbi:hypothetical protein QUA81_03570 [Microcoleus sp. F6_B4]
MPYDLCPLVPHLSEKGDTIFHVDVVHTIKAIARVRCVATPQSLNFIHKYGAATHRTD